MIIPVNNHILIEPLKYDPFISSDKNTYEEIGIVVNTGEFILPNEKLIPAGIDINLASDWIKQFPMVNIKIGDKVYFDSWLAAKYPKNNNEFYWLVKWEDIRAIERNEN